MKGPFARRSAVCLGCTVGLAVLSGMVASLVATAQEGEADSAEVASVAVAEQIGREPDRDPDDAAFWLPPDAPGDLHPPRDQKIGPLVTAAGGTREERLVVRRVRAFVERLSEGDLDTDAVAASERASFRRRFRVVLDRAYLPHEVRIGTISFPGNRGESQAVASIRLFGDPGDARGSVYLVREEGRWVIEDIALDFSLLSEPADPPDPYRPGDDGWSVR